MKSKIIVFFTLIMLMSALITNAQNNDSNLIEKESNDFNIISSEIVEVPVWEVGDKFIYKVDEFIIDFQEEEKGLYLDIKIDNLPLEVIDDSDGFYNLTFEATINGYFWLIFDLGEGIINISFELKSTTIEGFILVTQADIALKQINATISGEFIIKIIDQPYIDIDFDLEKKIDAIIKFDILFENARQPIVKYPFGIPECWGLPKENFTLEFCTIESPLFDNINWTNVKIVNPILEYLNNIINLPKIKELYEFSNILLDILPKVDICYILNDYLGRGCNFTSPAIPPIICCLGKDWVTIPAGTFECHNISILGTKIANLYFNETVGGIVNIIGNFNEIIPSVSNINVYLLSYEK